MNGSHKQRPPKSNQDPYPLVGPAAPKIPLPGRSDLSDWLDLMETVEMLCPARPAHDPDAERGSDYRL